MPGVVSSEGSGLQLQRSCLSNRQGKIDDNAVVGQKATLPGSKIDLLL